MSSDDAVEPTRPLLRVVKGDPTPEELAAVVAVVAALSAGGGGGTERYQRPLWSRPSGTHRRQLVPGPGAWRASALPRW